MALLLSFGCAAPPPPTRTPRAQAQPDADAETYKYCAGTVTEWEEHHCIWELTPEQQRRRAHSQRLVYQGGHVVRYETITGSGALYEGDDTQTHTYRYEHGRIVSWRNFNRNDVDRGSSTLSEGGQLVLWTDEQGRPRIEKGSSASGYLRTLSASGRVLSYAYVDSSGRGVPFEHVFKVEVKRSDQGAIVEESFFGASGEPLSNALGAHRVVHVVDARGMDLELRYFDERGRPVLAEGAHLVRMQYDDVGNRLSTAYFDLEGRPTLTSKEGAATLRFQYDAHGNEILRELFDARGRPVTGPGDYASRRRRFDDQDRPIEWATFDTLGAPVRTLHLGAATMQQTWDARGNVIRERLYDEDSRAISGVDGYHTVDIGYDARDNPTSYRYTDVNGAPVTVTQGYQWRKLTYDGDRLMRIEYFDERNQPVNTLKRYAIVEISYDADGSEAGRRRLDMAASPLFTCGGELSQELWNEIGDQATRTRSCYEWLLRESPQAEGHMSVELRIDQSGRVARASIVSDELAEPDLTKCVLSSMTVQFDTPPVGGCLVVQVPFDFPPTPAAPRP